MEQKTRSKFLAADVATRLPRTTPFSRLLRHAGGYNRTILTPNLIYIYCYVYSLPPCYFTQSALPNYQTGCCSVCYTCDLSRVTYCARCRFVCTAVTHL